MKLELDVRNKFHNERLVFSKTGWPKIEFIRVSHSRAQQPLSENFRACCG